jgi:hypothetical protein
MYVSRSRFPQSLDQNKYNSLRAFAANDRPTVLASPFPSIILRRRHAGMLAFWLDDDRLRLTPPCFLLLEVPAELM